MTGESLTPTDSAIQVRALCEAQIDRKTLIGYHSSLGMSLGDYIDRFGPAISEAIRSPHLSDGASLVIVDPLVPISDQIKLQGVDVGSGVYRFPENSPYWLPSPSWVKVVEATGRKTPEEFAEDLPENLRPASLLEALNMDFGKVLPPDSSVVVLGTQQRFNLQATPEGNVVINGQHSFYNPEDLDSTEGNVYTKRVLDGELVLVAFK